MEGHPHAEQRVVGLGQGGFVAFQQDPPGGLGPVLGVDVAQAAPALLQVGFEEEGDLPGPFVALGHRLPDNRQPPVGAALPLGLGPAGQLVAEGGVAGDEPHVEERRGGVEVGGGQGQRLLDRTDGVAELEAGVP